MANLIDLLLPHSTISIIGMSKNAGKTTTLNSILDGFNSKNIVVGLTSVGRDGESTDIVTSTDKPEIYVKKGTIVATSADLLKFCDITKKILYTFGINTPLGEVCAILAKSDGYVQISGPSINSQTALVSDTLKKFGASKILIDGAISRKTTCDPSFSDCAVLAVGTSSRANLIDIVSDAKFVIEMLTLKKFVLDENVISNFNTIDSVSVVFDDMTIAKFNIDDISNFTSKIKYILVKGALSNAMLEKITMSNINLTGVKIVIADSTKLFIKPGTYSKFLKTGAKIEVLKPVNLVAITANPFSAYGATFDCSKFLNMLSECTNIPVFNVLKGDYYEF